MLKKLNLKKLTIYSVTGTAVLFTVLLITVSIWIGYGVKEAVQFAEENYSGNKVEALIQIVDSDEYNIKERNSAIWALGQLGDRKALPVLEKYYTGNECNHKKELCQYELEKAIKQCQGGINITRFIWKNLFF